MTRQSGESQRRRVKGIRDLLGYIGDDPDREGLEQTPERMLRTYRDITQGYRITPADITEGGVFAGDYDDMVVVKDIDYYSLCEHDLLPFFGRVHVGYVAAGKVLGLSRIPRVVDMFSQRLQVQERMTRQIADFLMETLSPSGVGVVVEGAHLCMMMRGIKRENARVVTSAMLGGFRDDPRTRAEFLRVVGTGGDI
ncbi:MAG: GTP cyclohydrolase I FolE [Candidatus Eisenbacteria bacterium]|nr:GTP cyclohydrolase I FolE [Candidatus Eisenbacteria bacterium]